MTRDRSAPDPRGHIATPSGAMLALGVIIVGIGGGWFWSKRHEGPLDARTRQRLAPRQVEQGGSGNIGHAIVRP